MLAMVNRFLDSCFLLLLFYFFFGLLDLGAQILSDIMVTGSAGIFNSCFVV